MSIDTTGLDKRLTPQAIMLHINKDHPLLKLGNQLDWDELSHQVLSDLKATTRKKQWWRGRSLKLRIHLGAYLLQQLFNLTDRQTEYGLKDNAAYQLFCGYGIVKSGRLRRQLGD